MERPRRALGGSPRFAWRALSQALGLLEITWNVAYAADRGCPRCGGASWGRFSEVVTAFRPWEIGVAFSESCLGTGQVSTQRSRHRRAKWSIFRFARKNLLRLCFFAVSLPLFLSL